MNLASLPFSAINLADPFFDSLKADYKEFADWFAKKSADGSSVYVSHAENSVNGFLYLKRESEAVSDVEPQLQALPRIKVGTFKVDAHGTRLGERFMKKLFDHAMDLGVEEAYVTVFPRHGALIELLRRYGFKQAAVKRTHNGDELVLVRSFQTFSSDIVLDYPFFSTAGRNFAMLGIYPNWHTRLFPDSKLHNEPPNIVRDVSHTNSIHKVYLCAMEGVLGLKHGDVLLIYRTKDKNSSAPAHYTAVVTSVCVVEEVRQLRSFASVDEFIRYADPYSVFTKAELEDLWKTKRYPNVIRFTYNAAFKHRVTRAELLEQVGIPADAYSGFQSLTLPQLRHILALGKVHENLAID